MFAKHTYDYKGRFDFEAGGSLDGLRLVYHCSDRERRPEDKILWICHALTGNSDPEDWWPEMAGPGLPLDPEKYYIVCVNMICSPYGSTCPADINPETGKPWMMDFPKTTIRDIVAANILVRKHLGIESIDLMVGPSIGGFQTYEWTLMEPDVIKAAIFLATSSRVPPFLTAYNESQRMALLSDESFVHPETIKDGVMGLRCARSIALISYRTAAGYNLTQAEKDQDTLFADRAGSYQRYQGKKLSDRFDAWSYWYLAQSLDSHNVGRGRGGECAALASIKARTMVVSIDSDALFPPALGRKSAEAIPGCLYREISSVFGHDGFLINNDELIAITVPFIKEVMGE